MGQQRLHLFTNAYTISTIRSPLVPPIRAFILGGTRGVALVREVEECTREIIAQYSRAERNPHRTRPVM